MSSGPGKAWLTVCQVGGFDSSRSTDMPSSRSRCVVLSITVLCSCYGSLQPPVVHAVHLHSASRPAVSHWHLKSSHTVVRLIDLDSAAHIAQQAGSDYRMVMSLPMCAGKRAVCLLLLLQLAGTHLLTTKGCLWQQQRQANPPDSSR